MGTIFMWLKKSQSPKIFVAVPQASHFLTFNHLFAIIFSSAKDVVYINYTGRILRKRPAFWSPLPLYLSFLYDQNTTNKGILDLYRAIWVLKKKVWLLQLKDPTIFWCWMRLANSCRFQNILTFFLITIVIMKYIWW